MNSRNTRRVGHITCMESMRNAYKILVLISNGKRPWDDLGVDRKIILSRIGVTRKMDFGLDDWICYTLQIHNLGLQEIQLYRYSTHFQFTVTHSLGFSVFTSRILVTDLQPYHCNFKSHVKSSLHRKFLSCHFSSVTFDRLQNSTQFSF
jgi:hypothetical protein